MDFWILDVKLYLLFPSVTFTPGCTIMTRLMTTMYVYYDFYDLSHSSFIGFVVFLSNIEVVGPHFLFEEVILLTLG